MKHIAKHLHQLKPSPVDFFIERVVALKERYECLEDGDSDYERGYTDGFNYVKDFLEEIVKLYEVDCEIHQHNYKKALESYIENDYNVFIDEPVPF